MTETIRRTPRRLFAAVALIAALLSGAAASCDEGGMYQGGSDSAPGWRK